MKPMGHRARPLLYQAAAVGLHDAFSSAPHKFYR